MFKPVLIGALVAAMGGSASAGVVIIADDPEMADSNWSAFVVNPTGGFSFTASRAATGGNPGAYRAISHSSVDGHAQGTVVHTNVAVWDSGESGAISSLDFMVDVNCFNGGTSGAVAFGLVIVQGGDVYYGPTFTGLTGSGWRTDLRRTGLVAADFTRSGDAAHPDFSVCAQPMSFGFFSSNGTGSGIPISSSSGADNFVVRIETGGPSCAGDADGDGLVGLSDIAVLIQNWGRAVPPSPSCADLDGSSAIGLGDVAVVVQHWGESCG